MRVTLASYNIHRCIGREGRFDPARILSVLKELQADVIALQEAENFWHGGLEILNFFASQLNYEVIAGPTLFRKTGHYGNALLTRAQILHVDRVDLSIRGGEPRGALGVDLHHNGLRLYTVSTHLGLRATERRFQISHILAHLRAVDPRQPIALLGDINEWWPWSSALRALHSHLGASPGPATFPAHFPLLPLDRIWVWPRHTLISCSAHKTKLSQQASDHLPIKATVEPKFGSWNRSEGA